MLDLKKPIVGPIILNSQHDDKTKFHLDKTQKIWGHFIVEGWAVHLEEGCPIGGSMTIGTHGFDKTVAVSVQLHRPDVTDALRCAHAQRSGFRAVINRDRLLARNIDLRLNFGGGKQLSIVLDTKAFTSHNILTRLTMLLRATNLKRLGTALSLLINSEIKELRSRVFELTCSKGESPCLLDRGLVVPDGDVVLNMLRSGPQLSTKPLLEEITVIVPVFNDFEFLDPLFKSIFSNTDTPYKLVVIDDASTDSRVWPFLKEICGNRIDVILKRNQKNKGFSSTVNAAAGSADRHFVILNTDTEVPAHWLQRLMRPILADGAIASTTPFSNSATLFSFPNFSVDNDLIEGTSVDEVDLAFRKIRVPDHIPLEGPSGIDFCMGINGDVWSEIGGFDVSTFGTGYGEENDWCQRAIATGYRNELVPNLFVYHKHGASFGDRKRALMTEALKAINSRWPNYSVTVKDFIERDSWAPIRIAAFFALCLSSKRKPLIIVDHQRGGGGNSYRKQRVHKAVNAGRASVLITQNPSNGRIELDAKIGTSSARLSLRSIDDMRNLMELIPPFTEVVVSSLVGWQDYYKVLEQLIIWKQQYGIKLSVLFHDFFPICPSYTLLNEKNVYCGVPQSMETCNNCIKTNNNATLHVYIEKWRKYWSRLFANADEIVCFSRSSQDIVTRAFGSFADKMVVQPHEPLLNGLRTVSIKRSHCLVVGVVGVLNLAKGAQVVMNLCEFIRTKDRNAKVVVIGDIAPNEKRSFPNLTVHGRYKLDQLPHLLEQYEIDVCLLPSIWPETFSYVTGELMACEMPLVCFDIGAPAERVADYRYGILAREISNEVVWTALKEAADIPQKLDRAH